MKTRAWIIGCALTFLCSCASLPANDVKPATDLQLVRLGVEQLTREREPQGVVTRTEDAKDGEQLFGLAIALEDTNWLQNDDKRRIRRFVNAATLRIEHSRLPSCSWYQWRCLRARRALQAAIDDAGTPP